VPGRSNLRIRCPKGCGSSTLPSRTPSDLGISVLGLVRASGGEDVLPTLAHRARRSRGVAAAHVTVSSTQARAAVAGIFADRPVQSPVFALGALGSVVGFVGVREIRRLPH